MSDCRMINPARDEQILFDLAEHELQRSLGDSVKDLPQVEYECKMVEMLSLVELALEELHGNFSDEAFQQALARAQEELGINS